MKSYFEALTAHLVNQLKKSEHLFLGLFGESSQFVRLNGPKVRQLGTVDEVALQVTLVLGSKEGELRKGTYRIQLANRLAEDLSMLDAFLVRLRGEVSLLPWDPYAQLPVSSKSSSQEKRGSLLALNEVPDRLLGELNGIDIAGIYAAGKVYRGMSNSEGQLHWFSTENFVFDYSLYTQNKRAVKGTYSGSVWNQKAYLDEILAASKKLMVLEKQPKKLTRGKYRTYLAPAAFGDLVQMLSWGGISEASVQQGDSPLRFLRFEHKSLSPLFSVVEDFSFGDVPRFNSEGILAPSLLPLIEKGKLVNTWVSSRSAQEYGVQANGAEIDERLRSPLVKPGDLRVDQVLEKLGTGLYLSNLHYLNWSDQSGGRITGMTRYACFWIEGGELVAPIENLRFDDTLFNCFGDCLEALTDTPVFIPETGTYDMRSVGGQRMPGALLSEMEFTL